MHFRSIPRQPHFRRGAITPLTILCLALLVSVAALVIDGGTLMETRRHLQAAADAAALAGADDLYANYLSNQGVDVGGTAASSALSTAKANGFTDGDGKSSITVTVLTPPSLNQTYQGGPNVGKTIPRGYIEVIIHYNAPHLFSGVFGSGTSAIYARAVARGRCSPVSNNGVFAMSLSQAGAFNVASAGGLTINGTVQVNSSSSSALQASTSGKVTATQFILNPAMASSGGGGGGGSLLGAVLSLLGNVLSLLFGPGGSAANIVTSPPAPDPLRFLPAPPLPTIVQSNAKLIIKAGSTTPLSPGVYKDGIQISGTLLSPTTVTLKGNTDGTPNIYYLDGQNGLQVSGCVTIALDSYASANGVMIYNNWSDSNDAISINLGILGGITLVPPTSSLYRGLTIFQRPGTSASGGAGPALAINATGLANANITGTIYAAYANVSLATDLSTNGMAGQVIADTASFGGLGNLTINPGTNPSASQRQLGLVE